YFGVEVFTTGIFKAWMSMGEVTTAAQLSACLLVFVAVLIALERASRGRAGFASATRKRPAPQRLSGAAAWLALAACAMPVLLGFVLPAVLLANLAWGEPVSGARLRALVGNSFTLAGIAALLGVALATAMAYAARLARGPGSGPVALANRAAALGYALPGAVIAVGVLVPLGRLDNWVADGIEAATGAKPGLLLTGTIVALLYAYLVRFLAVALQAVEAGLAKITPRMDDAARSLGASPAKALVRVHAPLLASSLASAALLLFVDVMKELPATFALRPFNFDTLAIEAYNLAKDERLAEAAAPSLLIVAIGLVPLLVVTRRYFQPTRS
ncbi:MAG: iron ABC transporter permease, partial [Betaproteobacteria bacterium]|nr:iron ABC transporter permease [Betaproteobacteria bacterium]